MADLMKFSFASSLAKKEINEIIAINETTFEYRLTLSEKQAAELVETRNRVLKANGRVEFSSEIITAIIEEFCTSPYINQREYAHILNELIEIFYYYKNETLNIMSDYELIKIMKVYFDGSCGGSLELLKGKALENLARNIRFGIKEDEDAVSADKLEDEHGGLDE